MPSHKASDMLLKIGDGSMPESFATIGAARTISMTLNNQPADITSMGDGGIQVLEGGAGGQTMRLQLEGLFKDSQAEEVLRACAYGRAARNYQLFFPDGSIYAAVFVVDNYTRGGAHDGLETFSVTLSRSGAGSLTPGA